MLKAANNSLLTAIICLSKVLYLKEKKQLYRGITDT